MDAIEKEPSIGISYSLELPGKKQLVLQSFVARDCDQKELDRTLDKLRIASERQFAFGMVDVLKLQLEQEEKIAVDHARRMEQVDENVKADWARRGKKGEPTLSAQEQKAQREAYFHAEESKKRIAKVKQDMAEYQAKIDSVQPGA